jgi:hypothetical protein
VSVLPLSLRSSISWIKFVFVTLLVTGIFTWIGEILLDCLMYSISWSPFLFSSFTGLIFCWVVPENSREIKRIKVMVYYLLIVTINIITNNITIINKLIFNFIFTYYINKFKKIFKKKFAYIEMNDIGFHASFFN